MIEWFIKPIGRPRAPEPSEEGSSPPSDGRHSSLGVRLTLSLASLLVVSALALIVFAAVSARQAQTDNASQSMANVHGALRVLVTSSDHL